MTAELWGALQLILATLLPLPLPLPLPVGHLPAPVYCISLDAMQSGLRRANERLVGRFLNTRGDLIELWMNPPTGAWTMILIRHDTPWRACIAELGTESIDERPLYRRAQEWPFNLEPNP